MTRNIRRNRLAVAVAIAIGSTFSQLAGAVQMVDNDYYSIRWDNTIEYTLGLRAATPSATFLNNINMNDGDSIFKRGNVMTNRADVLSEFDFTLKDAHNSGFRVSAAAWYDTIYTSSHSAVPEATYNPTSVNNTTFNNTARTIAGRDIDLLDAFVHSGVDIGGHDLTFRLGRHTLLWGESLFLGTNGISAGQAPIDVIKALTVPGAQAKDLYLPVAQASAAFQVTNKVELQGYYQFEYRDYRMPPPGTYFGTADFLFNGGERLLFAPNVGIPHGHDINPPEGGQYGLAAKYRDPEHDLDLGLYYTSYTAKTPQVYTQLGVTGSGVAPTSYYFVYPKNIKAYGVSASTSIGDANVAGEISFHDNVPLVSNASSLAVLPGQNPGSTLYAVGRTLNAQVSTIYVVPRTPLWDTANLMAEIGGNYLLSVTQNASARNLDTSRTTFGGRILFSPTWYQVYPALDLSLPVVLGYTFTGPSAVDPAFNGTGAAHGGDFNIGVGFTYRKTLRGSLNYTRYIGSPANNLFADRDFVALNMIYSF